VQGDPFEALELTDALLDAGAALVEDLRKRHPGIIAANWLGERSGGSSMPVSLSG
jgi:hypothetical protein